MDFIKNFEEAEKVDKLKTKIMKYILYKKRTEQEIRQKFSEEDENLLEDIIDSLKETGYINDMDYVERSIKEYMALKNLSIKDMTYKIAQKGANKDSIDEYICQNKETVLEYEIASAKKNIIKKRNSNVEDEDIKKYLYQKGFMSETVNIAFDEVENEQ